MDPLIGQLLIFAGNFEPRGWAFCNGQILPISDNAALFSLLGTTYGGDGRTTFGLPDLRGRAPIHFGQGNGLTNHALGARVGQESITLTQNQLPAHNHPAQMMASAGTGTTNTADGNALAHSKGGAEPFLYNGNDPTIAMHTATVSVANTGGGQAVNNIQPVLALNYIIALQGIFPSRN